MTFFLNLVATLSFGVLIIIIFLYCRHQKYKQIMNMQYDYLYNYIEDPIVLHQYRERNNLGFGEEIDTSSL